VLDERSDVPAEERNPCPVCGSIARSFSVTGGAASATAIAETPKVHVESVPDDQTPEAGAIRGHYRATLDWQSLEDGHWLLQVVNELGEVVDGGVGDDTEEAC
jgi:hypothetical protein